MMFMAAWMVQQGIADGLQDDGNHGPLNFWDFSDKTVDADFIMVRSYEIAEFIGIETNN